MDLVSIVHTAVLVVAFLSGAYLVFATAQKADGVLKPVGTALAALLAAAALVFVVAHAMGKIGAGHEQENKPAAAATTTTDAAKPDGGK